MFDNVRSDVEHARIINGLPPGWFNVWVKTPLHPGVVAVLTYRFAAWVRRVRVPILRHVLLMVAMILRRVVYIGTGV